MKLFGSLDKYIISIGLVLFVVASVAYAYGQEDTQQEVRELYINKINNSTCLENNDETRNASSLSQSELDAYILVCTAQGLIK
jgi:hypothetical protein